MNFWIGVAVGVGVTLVSSIIAFFWWLNDLTKGWVTVKTCKHCDDPIKHDENGWYHKPYNGLPSHQGCLVSSFQRKNGYRPNAIVGSIAEPT
jgi:hypothetical protein